MKPVRMGLQGQMLALMVIALATVVALMLLLWQRQSAMRSEVISVSRGAMHQMVLDGLRRRGEAVAGQLADSLANPLYYFDLDVIVTIARAAQLGFAALERAHIGRHRQLPAVGFVGDDHFVPGIPTAVGQRSSWLKIEPPAVVQAPG